MKLSKLSLAVLLSVVSVGAFAQAKAPEPDYTLSFNAGVVTDYRYRGISQSRLKPAVQGGLDFAHKNGFYAGAWASSIKWISDYDLPGAPVDGSIELDLYGGYKGSITKDLGFDVGVLSYQYVGNSLKNTLGGGVYANANSTELYGALTYGPVTAKYSHSLGKTLFGAIDSKAAGYLDLSATFDLGDGWGVVPHVGHQKISSKATTFYGVPLSYTDYSLTVTKDFGSGFVGSAALVGTNADKVYYASPVNGKFLGKGGLVLGVKYNF
jgi:uncharacterized protein (TIGR02001 family)